MTRPKKDIKFQHRERHTSPGSISDSPTKGRMTARADGFSESPTGNGDALRQDRADAAAGWATDDKPSVKERSESKKKKQTFITRTIWAIVIIAFFFGSMLSGYIYVLIVVAAVQIVSYKEVVAIFGVPSRARSLRFTKTLNWYFLGSTIYFLYGKSVIYYFKHIVLVDKLLLLFAIHHRFISSMLYVMGFVLFVGSLRKGHYKFQFTQFAWTHMTLYLIVVQAHFIMNNIFEGMIWFFLPVSLIISNDIFAYVCGITFGRTQLIRISPKKTVEGFVGAWILTILFGFAMTNVLMRSKYFICPVNDLGANVFTGLGCDPNLVFIPQTYQLPLIPPNWTHLPTTLSVSPIQFHILIMANFASLIAPFGGFFASGLKHAFNIKNFGGSIPNHGSMTDRMNCQFIMGSFAFMYHQSFIAVYKASTGSVLETAITGLTPDEQVALAKLSAQHLVNQGQLAAPALRYLEAQFEALKG